MITMTLDEASVGETLTVTAINNSQTATIAMRLGIAEGETVQVTSKVPGGPLVVRRGRTEIALGRELCREIEVKPQGVAP